ncbi:hypothetical protein OAT42_03355 [Alphaproteobacteria bacterium]|nr:hypothetical protein [Alphaproteobacteria bacterium]
MLVYMENFSLKIIELRDRTLGKFDYLTLDELSIKIKELSVLETDELNKIALLAARISVLNKRVQAILNDAIVNDNNSNKSANNDNLIIKDILNSEKSDIKENPIEWVRVQIKETTEVNGVRFPEGIQIDVTVEDSIKIVESGKAILIGNEKNEPEKEES